MLKVIGWVLANLPLLIGAVTAAVALVEAMRELIVEPGPEKKKRALAILRENIARYIPLPPVIEKHLDAILGVLIDFVVLILNLTRGRDWGQQVESSVAEAVATVQPTGAPAVTTPTVSRETAATDARLDELEARLRRE